MSSLNCALGFHCRKASLTPSFAASFPWLLWLRGFSNNICRILKFMLVVYPSKYELHYLDIRKIFSSKNTFAFDPKKILICQPIKYNLQGEVISLHFRSCHSAIWPLNKRVFCILDHITGPTHVFNDIKEPEPSKINIPMIISSDMLGNTLCKQLADILKYFPLLKSNNKKLH